MSALDPTTPIEVLPNGNLAFQIYAQDGSFIPMECNDTPHNRRFVVWLRQHDRYSAEALSQRTEEAGE